MNPPRASSLRLITRVQSRPPKPPFGLSSWNPAASAGVVLLDATDVDLDDAAQVAAQIPAVDDLPPRTPLFILATAAKRRGPWPWLGWSAVAVARATRCAALLARGYVDLGANGEWAWGFSSPC